MKRIITYTCFALLLPFCLEAQDVISKSFELRYFLNESKADGETDFRGETEVFDTDWRLEYLKAYEKYAGQFFDNPGWDQLVVSDHEAKARLKQIKPQPDPFVRERIWLKEWNCIGYKAGQHEEDMVSLQRWNNHNGVSVTDETLIFEKKAGITIDIPEQDWRSLFEVDVFIPEKATFEWGIGDAVKITQGDIPKGKWATLSVDFDLESGKYNLMADGNPVVDFEPMIKNVVASTIVFRASKGVKLDNFHCVKYTRSHITEEDSHTRDVPFSIHTFLFEDFKLKPEIEGWEKMGYNDEVWDKQRLPYPHGGDRYKDESLYMRKIVEVGEFKEADIYLETLNPGGEVWVNGEVVHVQHHRHPVNVTISKYLKPDEKNLIAVRVYPNKVQYTNRHTASDLYTGSFAGRCYIDLRDNNYIKDVFVYTESISGSSAILNFSAEMILDKYIYMEREVKSFNEFHGKLHVALYKWFPEEDAQPAFEQEYPFRFRLYENKVLNTALMIDHPDLWTVNHPNLYKVR